MTDPLHSSRYSVEHAKRRLKEFRSEFDAWVHSNPTALVIEQNADGTEEVHKIKLVKPMPVALEGIAFDAINSLRSALDQAGYAVGIAAGTKGKKAHFPFGDTLADVVSQHKRGSKDLPKEIFDLMVSFKPYKGGNEFLWALNKLCNSHKHEIIIPVGMTTAGGSTRETAMTNVISIRFPPKWDRAKNEMELVRMKPGSKYRINFQIRTYIAIAKVGVMDGQPADGVIDNMVFHVDKILPAIDSKARSLGLFT